MKLHLEANKVCCRILPAYLLVITVLSSFFHIRCKERLCQYLEPIANDD